MIKTVLEMVKEEELGITLPHEHICAYSEYLYLMGKNEYLDKSVLKQVAIDCLKDLKDKYNLSTFVDCTPINIGRDIELLKEISLKSSVNIICATGFYFTDEPLLYGVSAETLADYIVSDAKNANAAIIKCAVEKKNLSFLDKKILIASAKAHQKLKLPIVLHTNARNHNGLQALEILLANGVDPNSITVGHLSDTEDIDYILQVAKKGCYIGLDRHYPDYSKDYIESKIGTIKTLCEYGYENKILVSHDMLFFNGFNEGTVINEKPKLSYCFKIFEENFPKELFDKIFVSNPVNMLKCGIDG